MAYTNIVQTDMSDPRNLYSILGVSHNSTEKDIKKAYRNLARVHHPDKSNVESDKKKFMEINKAYEILSDKEKRHKYDTYGVIDGENNVNVLNKDDIMIHIFKNIFNHSNNRVLKQSLF